MADTEVEAKEQVAAVAPDDAVPDVEEQNVAEPLPDEPLPESDDFMPKWFLNFVQYTVIFVFGLIMVIAICSLAFYMGDEMAFVLSGLFVENMDYICAGICVLILIGSTIGCWMTFTFGTVGSNVDRLKKGVDNIQQQVAEFNKLRDQLNDQVDNLRRGMRKLYQQKTALGKTVESFDKLTGDFEESAQSDEFGNEMKRMVGTLKVQYENMKLQNEIAEILAMFYEKINTANDGDDAADGLNEKEFEMLRMELDDDVKEHFPSFQDMEPEGGIVTFSKFNQKVVELFKQRLERLEQQEQVPRGMTRAVSIRASQAELLWND